MKIAYISYELQCKPNAKARSGVLLKVQFDEDLIGYADCHPWPEVGDEDLPMQLALLQKGQRTQLVKASIELALLDAEARKQKRPLLNSNSVPLSHYLGFNLLNWTESDSERIMKEGFTCVKFKVGKNTEAEIKQLLNLFNHSSLKLRLDFNHALSYESFLAYLKSIEQIKEKIEFIEDPFPFHAAQWQKIQECGWTLACDRQAVLGWGLAESARFLIIKPANMLSEEIFKHAPGQTKIVTSYVSHPLEQISAAYTAARLDPEKQFLHGLLSHRIFEETEFSRQLNWQGPQFLCPVGFGWGFDAEISRLKWTDLCG